MVQDDLSVALVALARVQECVLLLLESVLSILECFSRYFNVSIYSIAKRHTDACGSSDASMCSCDAGSGDPCAADADQRSGGVVRVSFGGVVMRGNWPKSGMELDRRRIFMRHRDSGGRRKMNGRRR